MQLQLIRNATLRLHYAGHLLLIDPFFAPRHSRPSYTGKSPNPLVELPLTTDEILAGVELVLVSHLHSDHFDPVAQQLVPRHLPLICQPGDEATIQGYGFAQVMPLTEPLTWGGIQLTRTEGHHGVGEVETMMGQVSGFVLQAPGEPTLYWAGDTVLCEEVRSVITQFQPDVIVTHSSGATWAISDGTRAPILMDAAQTIEVCWLAPRSQIIATHLDSLDHGTVSRADLRQAAEVVGITAAQLCIPADGETLLIQS